METQKITSPGAALLPLSPERMNGSRTHGSSILLQSPSMPEFGKPSLPADPFVSFNGITSPKSVTKSPSRSAMRHTRNKSSISNANPTDATVQTMIARFDNMSIKDYKTSHEAALRRMEMAREMAEVESGKLKEQMQTKDADARKMREEARKVKKELEEAKDRERKLMKRLDMLMDEFHRAKDEHSHTVSVYDKEVRRARKEAFKSSSSSVKLQEELKATKATLRAAQVNHESERLKSAKREQEAFAAQYQLVGSQEECATLNERIAVLEAERDTLKKSLQEEEVARIAAEGLIALPPPAEDDDFELVSSPSKSPSKRPMSMVAQNSDSEKENVVPVPKKSIMQLKSLQEELTIERKLRQKAQDQVEFMKMECQFQCCSCRIAEQSGTKYVHDDAFSLEMERIKVLGTSTSLIPVDVHPTDMDMEIDHEIRHASTPEPMEMHDTMDAEVEELERSIMAKKDDLVIEKPESLDVSMIRHQRRIPQGDESHTLLPSPNPASSLHSSNTYNQVEEKHSAQAEPKIEEPQTPGPHYEVRTITTTTTIPITFSPAPQKSSSNYTGYSSLPSTPRTVSHPSEYRNMMDPNSPHMNAFRPDGTLDREAALEMIRQRRGRARSVAVGQATPKKQMVEGAVRRDISAPSLKNYGSKKAGVHS